MKLDLRAGARYNQAYDAACQTVFDGLAGNAPTSEAAEDAFELAFNEAYTFLEHNHPGKLDVLMIATRAEDELVEVPYDRCR
jgi:hypothetical protein